MTIDKQIQGTLMDIKVGGRLDTTTAPELEAVLKESLEGIESLNFEFSELEYISSAGLRVLLAAQKIMNKQGSMTLTGVKAPIMEIFEVTGFSDILTIK